MKGSVFCAAVVIGVSVFLILNLFFGASGFYSYTELQSKKHRLAENITVLKGVQQDLSSRVEDLKKNSAEVAGHARELGFIKENEWIIQLEGYTPPGNSISPGMIFDPNTESAGLVDVSLVRSLAAAAGIIYLFFAGITGRKNTGSSK
ncbi:MAG: FtsB family cell division protein [Spirochaetia bacterium]